jgi:membrane protease subunit HflK
MEDQSGIDAVGGGARGALARLRGAIQGALAALGLAGRGASVFAAVVVLSWLLSGIYKVQPDEQGVVLRFGRWVDTQEPGLHYHFPWPFERVLLPKVTQVNQLQISGAPEGFVAANAAAAARAEASYQMLTGDENIVIADYVVFWKIQDAGRYLFRVAEPDAALRMAAESAMHAVIGRYPIQAALADKRQEIAEQARVTLQGILDSYDAGIFVTQVQLARVDPPSAVIDAFNDVQRARADQERARNEAEAYANDVLPRARGDAERMAQDAEAYKSQVVNVARGEVQSFLSLYESYRQARDVTAWRLYLDSVDQLLRKSGRVIIDSSGKGVSGIVPYLPMTDGRDKAGAADRGAAAPGTASTPAAGGQR